MIMLLVFELRQVAERHWRILSGFLHLTNVVLGVCFHVSIEVRDDVSARGNSVAAWLVTTVRWIWAFPLLLRRGPRRQLPWVQSNRLARRRLSYRCRIHRFPERRVAT